MLKYVQVINKITVSMGTYVSTVEAYTKIFVAYRDICIDEQSILRIHTQYT